MASKQQIEPLTKAIAECLAYDKDDLTSRPDWGSIRFDGAQHDLTRIFSIAKHLGLLPIDQLTDAAANDVKTKLDQVNAQLKAIDSFKIEQQNPGPARDSIVNQIHAVADQFYASASQWVPFLAYQKGDVAKNIEQLTAAVNEGKRIADSARKDIETKSREIENIITQAREASASAGAAVFTSAFLNEATEQNTSAKRWLVTAACFAVITLVAAVLMWRFPESNLTSGELTQKLGTKIAILVVLFTMTVWCGRIYRALRHQASVNKHRGLSLQTFQAFSAAAADVGTKDAVLMETTRAIFTVGATGFLDGKGSRDDPGTRMIEIVQNPSPVSVARAVADEIDT